MILKPAVFFDRDGVVNVSPGAGYVLHWSAFEFSPGIESALRLCRERGFLTVLVTSQQGVGRGLMSQTDLDEIHHRMQEKLAASGAEFDAIYSCTCLATDPDCTCRKPSPEMMFRAAQELGIDLSASVLVGDHDRDIEMAKRAGVPLTIRIQSEQPATIPATCFLEDTRLLADCLSTEFEKLGDRMNRE